MAVNACGQESTRGTTLSWATDEAGPYVEIGAVDSMPELNPTAETDECTDPYGAGDAGWREYFKTETFDAGEQTFAVNWTSGDDQHEALEDGFTSPNKFWFRINLSDANATKRTWPALITGLGHPLPQNGGKVQLSVTLKGSGAIVKTDSSS